MAQIDREKEVLYSRARSIEFDLSSASGTINDVESKLAYVEGAIGSLPSRLATVRGRGYAAMGHLEKSINLLTKKWTESAPLLKQTFISNVQPLNGQIRALEAETQRLRAEINAGNIASADSFASWVRGTSLQEFESALTSMGYDYLV